MSCTFSRWPIAEIDDGKADRAELQDLLDAAEPVRGIAAGLGGNVLGANCDMEFAGGGEARNHLHIERDPEGTGREVSVGEPCREEVHRADEACRKQGLRLVVNLAGPPTCSMAPRFMTTIGRRG